MRFRKAISVWIFCQTKKLFYFRFLFLENEVVEAGEVMLLQRNESLIETAIFIDRIRLN